MSETTAPPGGPGSATLLGSVELRGPTGRVVAVTRPQLQLVLAYLLLERRPVDRDEVADLLWGDRPLSTHWRGAVRGVLSKLRDLLAAAGIEAELVVGADGTVRLGLPHGFSTDVEDARRDTADAARALEAGDPLEAAERAGAWVDRLQQPFLTAADGDWVRSGQELVQDLARSAVAIEVRARIELAQPDIAALRAGEWVRRHPLDEGAHHLLIQALIADGRRLEAQAAHDRLATILSDELGLGPAAATTALLDAPAAAAPAPPAAPPAAPSARAARAPGPPVPTAATGPSSLLSTDPLFLGRARELEVLEGLWDDVVAGGTPRLVVLGGPSGIGKTRLAEELCSRLVARGATLRWGSCLAGSGLPFEPLASTLLGPDAGTRPADPPPDDPAIARATRFRSISEAVEALAASPAVLVVDDLQWASVDVLALLEHVLHDLRAPLLVVATGRNLPAGVHDSLARLQRQLPMRTIRLAGLDPDDLLPLFDRPDEGGAGAGAGAAALHRRTAGHPFFVSEIAIAPRRAGREIDPDDVPDAVREWIGYRADALDRQVRARLDLAAVLGVEFSAATLARCAQADRDEVLDQIEVLVDLGFLVETDVLDVFAFPHLITAEAVYDRLGPSRRARLHAAIADALTDSPSVPGRHAAIALHRRAAGPDHEREAARHASLAGAEALDSGAWSLAADLYRDALASAGPDPARRAAALTGLARALHRQRFLDEAEAALDEAVAIARANGLAEELADAVLVLVGRAGRGASRHLSDLEQAALIEEALAAVTARGTPVDRAAVVRRETLACELERELALALLLTAPADERSRLTQSAVDRARRLRPPDTRLTARALLTARITKLDPSLLPERIADMEQVLALPPSGRSIETTIAANAYRHEDLLRVGERIAARPPLDEATALARRHEHPYWTWATATWQALDHLIGGDLAAAEAEALAAASLQSPQEDGALACLGVNLVNLRLYQGRAEEVLALLSGAADDHPEIPCYRAVLALCAVEAGDLLGAEAAYGFFRADGFATIPDDPNRLLALAVLADTGVQLGDEVGAATLADLLLPYAGQHVLLNCYGGGGAYWGPVSHQLARLAALRGEQAEAERRFAEAERSAASIGSPLTEERISGDPMRTAV